MRRCQGTTVGSMAVFIALVCAALIGQTTASEPDFGALNAYLDPTTALQHLSVASIESGRATAAGTPVAIQEAYLKNMVSNATAPDKQSVRGLSPDSSSAPGSACVMIFIYCILHNNAEQSRTSSSTRSCKQSNSCSLAKYGLQEGYGQWPWNVERLPPANLTVSAESIINAFGQLPQCQVTVQVSKAWNTSSPGLVSAVVILVYQNWYAPLPVSNFC